MSKRSTVRYANEIEAAADGNNPGDLAEGADDREGNGDPFEEPDPEADQPIDFSLGRDPEPAAATGPWTAIEVARPSGVSINHLIDRISLPTISQCDETIELIADRIATLKAETTRIRAIKRHLLALDKCGMLYARGRDGEHSSEEKAVYDPNDPADGDEEELCPDCGNPEQRCVCDDPEKMCRSCGRPSNCIMNGLCGMCYELQGGIVLPGQ